MQFSLFFFTGEWPEAKGDHYRLFRESALFADRNGFEAVWTPERHFNAFGGLYPSPAVTGAALAAMTQRIGIRAGSVVLPLRNPVRVAEEWSVIDNLSQGRVGISVASGWHVNDFVLEPETYERRRDVMYKRLETVRRLWRGETIRLPNGVGNQTEVRIYPTPFQDEIPIWLTAQSEKTFEAAGEMGANVLTNVNYHAADELGAKIERYRASRVECGHGGSGHVTVMVHAFVGNEAAIEAEAKPAYAKYVLTNLDLQSEKAKGFGITVDSTEEDRLFIVSGAVDRMIGSVGLIGTPEHCLEQARAFEALGVDEIACLIDFGPGVDAVMESLVEIARMRERVGAA